jgi:hypothetical protein
MKVDGKFRIGTIMWESQVLVQDRYNNVGKPGPGSG